MKSPQLSAHLSEFPLHTRPPTPPNQLTVQPNRLSVRRTHHLTHHTKRRACRVRLHIDTSKARAADRICVVFVVLDRTAGSPMWVATETETGRGKPGAEGTCMRHAQPMARAEEFT